MASELTIVLEKLTDLIVANTVFVAQCAIDGATPADQVFWHANRPDVEGDVITPAPLARPFIIIKAEQFSYNEHSVGCMFPQMVVKMHVNDMYRSASFQDSAKAFTEFLGGFLEELSQQNMQSIVFRKVTQTAPPAAVSRRDETPTNGYWFAEYDLQIGADINV